MLTFRTATLCLAAAGLASAASAQLTGSIQVDGSSTVFPITEAVADAFSNENPNVRITVGVSGTGGGFKRFTVGEIDVSDASRPIKASEHEACEEHGIEYIEVPVAYDGLTIAVHPENDWVDQLTVDQLRLMFLAANQNTTVQWSDVDPSWPEMDIEFYAPGTDSGTYDYFNEVVASEDGETIRSDMSFSENDNELVTGVSGDRGSIGFFGCAYYFENQDKLRAVPIVNGDGDAVLPNPETIESGDYNPFARPLFIYVNEASLRRPEVAAFIEFYLDEGGELAEEVGYVRLPDEVMDAAWFNVDERVTGTFYLDAEGEKVEGPVTEVYTAGRDED